MDSKDIIENVELRCLQISDYRELCSSMTDAYASWVGGTCWRESDIERLLEAFPQGQFCVTVNGKVVASALTLVVNYSRFGDNHTYTQITGNYSFSTHDPNGDVLYGIEVFVDPARRGLRLGRRLYDARKELCEQLNLRSIIAGGRIPNYSGHEAEFSPREYIEKVQRREIIDPVLTFQLANDFKILKVLKNYMPDDAESSAYATLLEWRNIYYQDTKTLINLPRNTVRLGLIQWQMRRFPNLEALCEQIEFFLDTLSGYKSDFALFPELFNAPLMADYNHLKEAAAIRRLAEFTEPLRKCFVQYAISYNINIITGSLPFVDDDGSLRNVGFLCRRNGTWERYEKLHITPNEVTYWGMVGGQKLRVFDTDCGNIGVLICYDSEFPELARLLADQGMRILFVPFLTDTQNGYSRVRNCAQARAIENECYVAIAGSVGNLPRVNNMDIQYAQSAVFTPCDFAFPTNGIKAEATPNTEMTLIADVDIDLLNELHTLGSVRNLNDRRKDLYHLSLREPSS